MSGPMRPFDPAELEGVGDAASQADALAAARALEGVARADTVSPSSGFEDRVMAAIAREPAPRRAAAAGGGLAGLFGAIGLAWQDLWGGGRPAAVRFQALALLVVVAMVAGSIGAIATVGVSNVLFPNPTTPPAIPPSTQPSTGPTPSVSPSALPTPSPTPAETASPPATPSPTPGATQTAEPTGTDDHGGGAGGTPTPHPSAAPTAKPTTKPTTKPSGTPRPTATDHPEDTPDPTGTDDHGSGSGGSGDDSDPTEEPS
jgi:hypothetical protein